MTDTDDVIITLLVDNTPCIWLRNELISHSDYFKAMFEGNFAESSKNTITIQGVDAASIKTIQKLTLDRDYIIGEELIVSVLQAACMLQFLSVKESCVEQMMQLLSVQNCLKFWVVGEQLNVEEIYLKAKLMAFLEFMSVKETSSFLELSFTVVLNYLGSVFLHAVEEMAVFETALQWYQHYDEKSEDNLFKLLKCLDFKSLSSHEIDKICANEFVQKFPNLVHILEVAKKGTHPLLNSKSRNLQGFPAFLFIDSSKETQRNKPDETVIFSDKFKRKLRYSKLSSSSGSFAFLGSVNKDLKNFFGLESLSELTGYTLIGHKHRVVLIGGETSLGKSQWNTQLYVYDVMADQWRTLAPPSSAAPFKRRHFQSCIINDRYLFVVGGTAKFRTIQTNMLWYDLTDGLWSKPLELPYPIESQLNCCPFGEKLFLLNIVEKCGYLFCLRGSWLTVDIHDPNNVLPSFSKRLSLCSYRGYIYIKDEKLYQLKLNEPTSFTIVNVVDLPVNYDCNSHVESVLCHNVLHSLVTQVTDSGSEKIFLESLNLDSCELSTSYHSTLDDPTNVKLKLINMFHPTLVSENVLVNEI